VALLHEAFDLAKNIGGLVVDESSRVELKEAMVQGMAAGYETFYNLCNEAIAFHITGMRTVQQPAGMNAGQSNFAGSVREDVRMMDNMMLAESCWRQIAIPFRDLNGLKGCVKFVWGGLSENDAKTFSEFLKTMSDAGYEADDTSLTTVNERTGLSWKRKAATPPANNFPPANNLPGKPTEPDEDDITTMSASRLMWLSAGGRTAKSPVDDVVAQHADALAKTFRGQLAPVRQIILNSSSRADCEHKLKLFFADWPADKIAGIVDEAMQVCAAKGAAKATEK
jgi:phage gp29-like protein